MLKSTIKSMQSLFFSMSFLFIGASLIVASGAVMLKELGKSDLEVGLVSASYFLGGLISTITAHRAVARVGHIRAFGALSSLFAFACIMHLASSETWVWCILRLLVGYSFHAQLMIIEAWLNEQTSNDIRGRVLSVYEILYYSCGGLGALILTLALRAEQNMLVAIGLLMLCAIPLNLMRIKEPVQPKSIHISIPKMYGLSRLALVCCFCGGMLMNGLNSMGAMFILGLGKSVADVGLFISCAMFGGFVGQSLVGVLSDKFGRKIIITACAGVALFAAILMLFLSDITMLCAASAIFGMGGFCLYALGLARANDKAKSAGECLEIGRSLLFSFSIGSLLCPLVLGLAQSYFGSRGFMGFYVILLTCLLLFSIRQPILPKEQRKDFKRHMMTSPEDDVCHL